MSQVISELIDTLKCELPPGRLIKSECGEGESAPLWMSDEPAGFDDWSRACRLRAEGTGVWPVLLDGPWAADSWLSPKEPEQIARYDARALLAALWRSHALPYLAEGEEEDDVFRRNRLDTIAPFGEEWPGVAPAIEAVQDPDQFLDEFGDLLISFKDDLHLGLVQARSGAEALTALGWTGPVNYATTPEISAMVADWEKRFGARVVCLGFDVLHLSVAAPPKTLAEALPIAAEHFAFCPDNVSQGEMPCTIRAYAERIVGEEAWIFWWD